MSEPTKLPPPIPPSAAKEPSTSVPPAREPGVSAEPPPSVILPNRPAERSEVPTGRAKDVYSATLAALRARQAGAAARAGGKVEPARTARKAAAPEEKADGPKPAAGAAQTPGQKPDLAKAAAPSRPQPAPVARSSAPLAWIVAALAVLVAGGGLFAFFSSRADVEAARAAHAESLVSIGTLRAENEALEARVAELDVSRKQLEEEARAKAEALAAMEQTQAELQQRLQAEVEKGSVLISQQHGELVVDLLDKVVFDSGEAELNERGKAVLFQVGETLARVPDKIIQVSGHTDSWPITRKLEERFPTNWELSTARATHVVRYLQDVVQIPGNRLVAAGLAEFRPIARNTTRAGRSKNRRIEVRLLPMPKK